MTQTHTPGPWLSSGTAGHETHGQYAVYHEGTGKDIAIVYDGKAHANLIAAAPDLPNGCHPDCPACAEERTVEENLEHEASERIRSAAPELLAALEATLAYLHNHLPKGNIRESAHFRALNEHAGLCKAAHVAIAKAKGQNQ